MTLDIENFNYFLIGETHHYIHWWILMENWKCLDFDFDDCIFTENAMNIFLILGQKLRSGSTYGDLDSSLQPCLAPTRTILGSSTLSKRKSLSNRKFSLRNIDSISSDCDRPKPTPLETLEEKEKETVDKSLRLTQQSLEQFSNSPEGNCLDVCCKENNFLLSVIVC